MKLPLNCSVEYVPDFLDKRVADELYRVLIEQYNLNNERLVIEAGGQVTSTDSFKILFSTEELIEQNQHPEHIYGKCHIWSGEMANLREKVEGFTKARFDVAMCLYYPDGNFFAPYHSDQETSGAQTILPSISLGEVREFNFRDNERGDIYSLALGHGSMLVMGGWCQRRYEHTLPKNPQCQHGRINITFRESSFQ